MSDNPRLALWGTVAALVAFAALRIGLVILFHDPHRYDRRAPTAEPGAAACRGTMTEPAYGRVAWTLRSVVQATQPVPFHPLVARDGFIVAVGDCIALVDAKGSPRWTIKGEFHAGAIAGDTVVLGGFDGWPRVVGLDVATGMRRWSSGVEVQRGGISATGNSVLLAGDSLTIVSATTGKRTSDSDSPSGDYRYLLAAGDLLVAGGATSESAGGVVAFDAQGHLVTNAKVDILVPQPIAVTSDVIVVMTDGGISGAPLRAATTDPTIAGVDRLTGRTRWSHRLPSRPSPEVIAVDGILVLPADKGVIGVDAGTGQVQWRRGDLEDLPVRLDNQSFVSRADVGPIEAVDGRTGVTRWSQEIKGFALARMRSVDGKALLQESFDGQLVLRRATDGSVVWSGAGPRLSGAVIGVVTPPVAVIGSIGISQVDGQQAIGIETG